MSEPNPYAAPKAKLDSPPSPPVQEHRAADLVIRWVLVVPMNAIAGFMLALLAGFNSPAAMMGMMFGIAVIGFFYLSVEATLRSSGLTTLAHILVSGALLRIPFQIVPIAELWAYGLVVHVWPTVDPPAAGWPSLTELLVTFGLTLAVGFQLAIMAIVLGVLLELGRRAFQS
jgi:hypothetical protein